MLSIRRFFEEFQQQPFETPEEAPVGGFGSGFIVDSKGRRYQGMTRSGGGSDDRYSWKYEFPSGIEEPRKLVLKWVEEFYRVEIPFRLEGVRLALVFVPGQ